MTPYWQEVAAMCQQTLRESSVQLDEIRRKLCTVIPDETRRRLKEQEQSIGKTMSEAAQLLLKAEETANA